MIPISEWYDSLGRYTFPTVFISLRTAEREALLAEPGQDRIVQSGEGAAGGIAGLQSAMRSLPGSCFIGADVCAPTDSPLFADAASVTSGERAWAMLRTSDKVRQAFKQQATSRLTVRPYRNMNRIREFRLFFHDRRLVAMSQLNLQRHFARFARRQDYLWSAAMKLATEIQSGLPRDDLTVDIYFCSNGDILLIDMNQWGEPTDPLLLRSWNQDWNREIGLKLIPPPVRLKGNVSVSF